jgi:thiol-disulfide isomerase/thioredoxin
MPLANKSAALSKTFTWLNTFPLLAFLAVCVGCGGSDSGSVVVPPPAPAVAAPTEPTKEPPGSMELPKDVEIPAPTLAPETAPSGGIEMPSDVEVPAKQAANTPSQVQYANWEQIQTFAKSTGKITVVDLWSLACEPCLKEFPGLVRLHQAHGDQVQCVAVDLDFDGRKSRPPEHYEADVAAFLKSVGASGFPTYISQTPNDEVFSAAKLVSIPAVLIYDAQGQVVKVFVDAGDSLGFTYDKDVIPLVKSLLNPA